MIPHAPCCECKVCQKIPKDPETFGESYTINGMTYELVSFEYSKVQDEWLVIVKRLPKVCGDPFTFHQDTLGAFNSFCKAEKFEERSDG